jgi:hypothetical protein
MFPKKSQHTAQNVKLTENTPLASTRLENAELSQKVNATTNAKKKATVDKNTRFRGNSAKPPKNKPCALNAKSAVTCATEAAFD